MRSKKHSSNCEGNALILALITLTVLAGFAGNALLMTTNNSRMAVRQGKLSKAQIAADGAIDTYFSRWKSAVEQNKFLALSSAQLAAIPTPQPTLNAGFATDGITFSQQAIEVCDPWGSPVNALNPNGYTTTGSLPALGFLVKNVTGYPDMVGFTTYYRAKTRATIPASVGMSKPTVSEVRRNFELTSVSLFQFLPFFEEDIEIHPGDDMTLVGNLHTNKEAWARATTYVKIFNKLSYVTAYHDDLSPERKAMGTGANKDVTWADDKPSSTSVTKNQQLNKVNRIELFGNAPSMAFNTGDSNPNNDSFSELIEVPNSKWNTTTKTFDYNLPTGATPNQAEIEGRRLYNNADVIIKIDSSKATTDPTRITVTGPNLTAAGITAIKAAVLTTTNLYDFRQSGTAPVTSVDMKKLTAAAANGANFTAGKSFNGIAYIYDAKAGKNGIRLQNGAELDTDITVASEDAVYIQGDYNTGGGYNDTAAGKTHNVNAVPSNASGNPAGTDSTLASGYVKKAAAVVGDAVMVLSNNWNDANASKSLSYRTASHTTLNVGLVAGYLPTDSNNNNAPGGGIHNLQRFLENWNSKSFTFMGSMVQTTVSQQWTGLWDTGNIYSPPDRHWVFDSDFLKKPPKGGISGAVYSRGRWERENFNN